MTWRLPVTVTKKSPILAGFLHRQHAETVHNGFDRLDRIDLGDDDVRTHTAGTHRDTFTAPAVTDDDERLAGEQDVCRTDNAVERGLASAVAVIKEMLGLSVVDSDRREVEHARFLHRFEAYNAGRGLFGRADQRFG